MNGFCCSVSRCVSLFFGGREANEAVIAARPRFSPQSVDQVGDVGGARAREEDYASAGEYRCQERRDTDFVDDDLAASTVLPDCCGERAIPAGDEFRV